MTGTAIIIIITIAVNPKVYALSFNDVPVITESHLVLTKTSGDGYYCSYLTSQKNAGSQTWTRLGKGQRPKRPGGALHS